jgi:hypothetical protein
MVFWQLTLSDDQAKSVGSHFEMLQMKEPSWKALIGEQLAARLAGFAKY